MKTPNLLVLIVLAAAVQAFAQEHGVTYLSPSWSSDGKFIAFTKMDVTQSKPPKIDSDIYVIAADGTGMRRVTSDPQNEFESAFSRDGKRVFFRITLEQGKRSAIYSADLDGTSLVRITAEGSMASAPQLSRDGKWIVFNMAAVANKPQINVMKADGTRLKALTADNTLAFYNPVWSPDRKQIVYYVERGDNKDQIWSMNADGTDQKMLTNNIGHNFYPSWTADGRHILFTSTRDGKAQIYSMKPDGSEVKPIGVESSYARQSPDGKRLVYVTGNFPNTMIYVSNIDGSDPRKLVP